MPDDGSLSDNAALNAIVDELEAIETELTEDYDFVTGHTGFHGVDSSITYTRDPEPLARKTVVSNIGPNKCIVKEDNLIVLVVPGGESRPLPLNGKGQIKVNCLSGQSAGIAVSTFFKEDTQ